MKELVRTSRAAGYLEKLYRAINQDWFSGEVEEPIITIQTTPNAYGHVTVGKTWRRKDDWRHELNIGAQTLDRPIDEVVATLVHEMVHLYNIQHNVQDCSRGGMYHNAKFRDEAQRRGLEIVQEGNYGWCRTSASEALINYIITKGWTEIDINRGGSGYSGTPGTKAGESGAGDKQRKPSSTRKYVCPCCGQSVRATKVVNIICGDCNEKMIEA